MEENSLDSKFLVSVIQPVRKACQANLDFKNRVCVTGYICIDIDGEHQSHFVINELIRSLQNGVTSESFSLKTLDQESLPCKSSTRPPDAAIGESYTCLSRDHKNDSRLKDDTSDQMPSPEVEQSRQEPVQKLQVQKTAMVPGSKPYLLAKLRSRKANRTFTIDSEDDLSYKEKVSNVSETPSPKKAIAIRRLENDYMKERGSASLSNASVASNCSSISGISRGPSRKGSRYNFSDRTRNNSPNRFYSTSNFNKKVLPLTKRPKTPTNTYHALKKQQQSPSGFYDPSDSEMDISTHSRSINDQFPFSDKHLDDIDNSIASTKPPKDLISIDSDFPQQSPCNFKSETYASPPKNLRGTLSTPNVSTQKNKTKFSNPDEISTLLTNVIEALYNSTSRNEKLSGSQFASPDSIAGDHQQPSSVYADASHGSSVDCKYNEVLSKCKNTEISQLLNVASCDALEGCADVEESPSVIKKKARLFRWLKFFNKKESNSYQSQNPRQGIPIPITESHTSVASTYSSIRRAKSPIFKKRRIGR